MQSFVKDFFLITKIEIVANIKVLPYLQVKVDKKKDLGEKKKKNSQEWVKKKTKNEGAHKDLLPLSIECWNRKAHKSSQEQICPQKSKNSINKS